MNTLTKITSITALSFLFTVPMTMSAQAITLDEAVGKVVDTVISKASTSTAFTDKFCRKASLLSGVVSVRSLDGLACNNLGIAATSEIVCTGGNLDDYANSKCHKNAVAVLNGRDPVEALKSSVKGQVTKLNTALCAKKDTLPPKVQAALAASCPTAAIPAAPSAPPVPAR